MGLFGAALGWSGGGGGAKRPPLPKICHTYPTMIQHDTIIPYLKKIQKIYKSRDRLNNKHDCNLMMSAKLATLGLLKIKVF